MAACVVVAIYMHISHMPLITTTITDESGDYVGTQHKVEIIIPMCDTHECHRSIV